MDNELLIFNPDDFTTEELYDILVKGGYYDA